MEENKREYKTAARTHITEYLIKHADRTVTVGDIMANLQEKSLDINISTVYRYLGKLTEEGTVNKYAADKGDMAVYQYAGTAHRCDGHLHMQCTECGRVIHLDCGFMDEFAEHIREHHGFEILCRGSILYGVCKECRKEMSTKLWKP